MKKRLVLISVLVGLSVSLGAQRPSIGNNIRQFVKVDAPEIAITHVRVIDGTGAPARDDQTIVIRDGNIAAIGPAATTTVPQGAVTVDGTGKSVMPGLVMVHEHLYYPQGSGVYGQLGESFIRLYLAGGVTTIRTGGNVNGFMDLNLKQLVDSGQRAGPAIDATAPYLNGPNTFVQMRAITDAADARRQVAYWADMGATSFKGYMQISRAALGAAIEEAHARKLKVTGHLCSVTYSEAAALGIDNLEHGFAASTDFVADKKPDVCPGQGAGQQTIRDLDPEGQPFRALVKTLVDRNVALTSTLAVFETFTPKRPMPPGVDVLVSELRAQYERTWERVSQNTSSIYATLFPKADGARAGVRTRRRHAHRRHRSHRIRRRDSWLFESADPRAARRSGLHAARGDPHRLLQRGEVSRPRRQSRHHRCRETGRPRADRRRSLR